jgi:hypothetical protein
MSLMDDTLVLAPRPSLLANVTRLVTSPRFLVYSCCTLLALLTTYHLGKDMVWDTLDYHFYAGFSALHDRFGQDYFAGGPQGYLNPYIYVPFYLLATSGLTGLEVAFILAAVQSVILWLVYELTLTVASPATARSRMALGICAVALAFANPVLINQLGSSFADILTAEMALAGWLLLVGAVRTPSARRIVYAALLLGCATALKLTNAVDAVSAAVIVLFIPGGWRTRLRHAALFAVGGVAAFAAVAAPWSVRLQENFGNPFFPLLNGIFRSPQLTTARMIDYRFIPWSLGAALWRPFAMVAPRTLIHVESAAPDLRYALLLVVGLLSFLAWGWKRWHGNAVMAREAPLKGSERALAALGAGFLVGWLLWLPASGNSRYFIPMACVAAVLATVLTFRLFATRPKVRNYVLLAVFMVQLFQLRYGTQYPPNFPWSREPWFKVAVPESLASEPALYFNIGTQSDSFIAPYLAPGSGLINLQGDYTLGPGGANGRHIEALIRRYSPRVRILMPDGQSAAVYPTLHRLLNASDALEPFGLQPDTHGCARIAATTGYFVSCPVVTEKTRDAALLAAESGANIALDRLEDACPAIFQPRRQVSYLLGDPARNYIWVRRYDNTDVIAWVAKGLVHYQGLLSQRGSAGSVSAWDKAPLRVHCGREAGRYFLQVIGPRT